MLVQHTGLPMDWNEYLMQYLSQLQLCKKELLDCAIEHEEIKLYIPKIQALPAPDKIILLTGTFGIGKTRLLNSLLDDPLFPTSPLPMRQYYVRLGHRSALHGNVIYPNREEQIDVSQMVLKKLVDSDDKNSIVGFEVKGPYPLLCNGWELVETPGLGEINPAHQSVTEVLLEQSMALIFLIDAISSPQDYEEKFLNHIPEHVSHLCLVIMNLEKIPANQQLSALNALLWSMKKIIGKNDYSVVVLSEESKEGWNGDDIRWGAGSVSDFIKTVCTTGYSGNRAYISEFIELANEMLVTIDKPEEDLPGDGNQSSSDAEMDERVNRVKMLLTVIHDQHRDIIHQMIESYQAEIFRYNRGASRDTFITPLVRLATIEDDERELHEQLLVWLVKQQSSLQTSLQELYDKIYAEWTFMTGKQQDRVFVELNIDNLVNRLKDRIYDPYFNRLLLNGLSDLIMQKVEDLDNYLVTSQSDSLLQKIVAAGKKPVQKRLEEIIIELNGLM